MSKKSKVVEPPKVWANLTAPDKSVAARSVSIDMQNKAHVFANKETREKLKVEIPSQAHWDGMEEYMKVNKQTALAYHEQFVGAIPKDEEETVIKFMTWAWFAKNGEVHMAGTTADGEVERKSSLAGRLYWATGTEGAPKTPQAQTCLKILKESVHKDGPNKGKITEEDLKKAINARAAEIRTRQDPWRIFQYYRPTLVKAGFIKHT
jgi:hypothetical protein